MTKQKETTLLIVSLHKFLATCNKAKNGNFLDKILPSLQFSWVVAVLSQN